MTDLKGKKIGMSPTGSATHAIATAILSNNFGLKPHDYSVAPGHEAQLAQFLSQKEIDAGVLRSVTLAQIEEIKPRRLANVVDEWKKLTKGNAPPILAVTIVYNDYLAKNQEAVTKFIVATRNALQFGSKKQEPGCGNSTKSGKHERCTCTGLCESVGRSLHREL